MGMKIVAIILLAAGSVISLPDPRHPRQARDVRAEEEPRLGIDENESDFWRNKAQQSLQDKLLVKPNVNKAKNVILFLGDGMSIPTLTAARVYQSELGGSKIGEGSSLFFESFPYTGLSKTYCVDLKVADSACSATAYLTGVKANYGTIGVNGKVLRGDCAAMRDPQNHVDSIAKWFQDAGRATGIVTTTRVTHASPAGTYAHTAERDWEYDEDIVSDGLDPILCDDIAEQLVYNEPGRNFNVILGGGKGNFLPNDADGYRTDGKNLVNEWMASKSNTTFVYTTGRDGLNWAAPPEYVLGLFKKSHMEYHLDNNADDPTLAEMTEKAIQVLQNTQKGSQEGFFLFVEGGKIDIAHHDNLAHIALDETVEFEKAVRAAKAMTNESETLIIVTADHAHTMSISGYPSRASTIFGTAGKGDDKLPYSILNYANGPSYKTPKNNERYDIGNDDMTVKDYQFPAAVPLGSETHGGDDVAVFANGPWSHLFTGSLEENYLPHAMAFASCVGQGKTVCD